MRQDIDSDEEEDGFQAKMTCAVWLGGSVVNIVIFAWFLYSGLIEILDDQKYIDEVLQNATCYLPEFNETQWGYSPSESRQFFNGTGWQLDNVTFINSTLTDCDLDGEISALNTFNIITIVNMSIFILTALIMAVFKVRMVEDCRISPKESHVTDQMDKALSAITLAYCIFNGAKVLVYFSLLNKFEYWELWDSDLESFGLGDLGLPLWPAVYETVGDATKGLAIRVSLNVLRTFWFFQIVNFAFKEGMARVLVQFYLGFVTLPFTALFAGKIVTSIFLFHNTQKVYTSVGDFEMNTLILITIIGVAFTGLSLCTLFYFHFVSLFLGLRFVKKHRWCDKLLVRGCLILPLVYMIFSLICPLVIGFIHENWEEEYLLFVLDVVFNMLFIALIMWALVSPITYQRTILKMICDKEGLKREEKYRSRFQMRYLNSRDNIADSRSDLRHRSHARASTQDVKVSSSSRGR